MMSATTQATNAMTKLSLNPPRPKSKSKKQVVVDSWEDEESDVSEVEPVTPSAQPDDREGVAAPPPTPLSPSEKRLGPNGEVTNNAPWLAAGTTGGVGYGFETPQDDSGPRRPEKTDAVARRMIASALGVRAPRMTEEQRAYDRALREKERKRREEEREAERKRKEEAERARAAMWDD
ncbi:hypothetical protein GGS20DRAFT_133056 [Poronia punctata]|nr:hypothetical protein GGS20DRAFT_133056 [Poronia punctata]